MDISDTNATLPSNADMQQVRKDQADAKAKPDTADDIPRPVEDNDKLSQSTRDVQYAKKMIKTVPDVRQAKVARLKNQIDSGTYRIDSQKVAEKMIKDSIINELLSE